MNHRCPFFGSVCSAMRGNGQTKVTVPSDIGRILSQIKMETVHCMTPSRRPGLTEDVYTFFPSSAIKVSSMYGICFLFVKKGMNYLGLQRWIGNIGYFGS